MADQAGELGSGVLTASDWDKPTHLACAVRRTYFRSWVRVARSSNAAGKSVRLLRSMWVKEAPLRAGAFLVTVRSAARRELITLRAGTGLLAAMIR